MYPGDDERVVLTRTQKTLARAREDIVKTRMKADPTFYTTNLSLAELPNPMAMRFIETTMGSAGKAKVLDVLEQQRSGYYERLECQAGEEKVFDKHTRIARCKPKPEMVAKRVAVLDKMNKIIDNKEKIFGDNERAENRIAGELVDRYSRAKTRCEHLNKISPGDYELVINHLYQASCVEDGAFGEINCDTQKNPKLSKAINLGGINICVDPELHAELNGRFSGFKRDTSRISEKDMKELSELVRMFNSMESVYKENAEDILNIIRKKRRLSAVMKYTEAKANPFTNKIQATIRDKDDSYVRLLANGMYLGLRTSFPDFFSDKFGTTDEYYQNTFGVNLSDLSKSVAEAHKEEPSATAESDAGATTFAGFGQRTPRTF